MQAQRLKIENLKREYDALRAQETEGHTLMSRPSGVPLKSSIQHQRMGTVGQDHTRGTFIMEGGMSPNGVGGDMMIENARSTGFINQEDIEVRPQDNSGLRHIGREP